MCNQTPWLRFKGTVSVISNDPPCKEGNVRFTTVPLKGLSNKAWIRNSCFCFFKLLISICESNLRIITFLGRKPTVSSIYLIRLRFQGSRWKSDLAIFAWSVTWIYTHSPFNFSKIRNQIPKPRFKGLTNNFNRVKSIKIRFKSKHL